ncbi:hypothetical protein GF318_02750 [Candidatus Micrarchaeota archaeon]|nr:hypothetical protein [Candidatus Micrarchaeota archaeon]
MCLTACNNYIIYLHKSAMRQALPILSFLIAATAMYLILVNGIELPSEYEIFAALVSIAAIGGLSIAGLFEKSIIRYAYFSAAIQFGYFMLDASTALLIDKSVWFAVIQFINFVIAGGLFAIVISLLYNTVRKEQVPEYSGLYEKNQLLGLVLAVSCLSLGGMPGFNIFVGEYLIYGSLFAVHPALTLMAVFASLVAFIFYFRICYVMFAGTESRKINCGIITKAVLVVLALLTVGLGMLPQILFRVLEMYI